MELKTVFDLPDNIYAGILKGNYVRTGGVIQVASGKPDAGSVVAWLREISSAPLPSDSLTKNNFLHDAFGMAGSVASILNLGATVCFGTKILNRLKIIEQKTDRLNQKMDDLQWTVELGFSSVLKQIDLLAGYHEAEIIAELKTAAELSWTAQFLEPDSDQRMQRIELALGYIIKSLEKLTILAKNGMNVKIGYFRKISAEARIRLTDDSAISVLQRFRQAILALSLRASIHAEAGDFKSCSQRLENLHLDFKNLFIEFGNAFIRGAGYPMYEYLLNKKWKGIVSPQRVDIWSKRFDPETEGICNILEQCRDLNSPISPIEKEINWSESTIKNAPVFYDLLDGIYEDLERLEGHLAEYKNASSQNLSIHEYRRILNIEEIKDDRNLAFLVEK
ncbi:MAG: hypothetical protein DRI57_14855 [Deltaproteobacteria bacterium]|nr:MAG: hypothetical protein DRI57_14855 [Deltaproteobacteria bacterium]